LKPISIKIYEEAPRPLFHVTFDTKGVDITDAVNYDYAVVMTYSELDQIHAASLEARQSISANTTEARHDEDT